MHQPASVSIVVPAHRSGPILNACLDSLAALQPPPREIIIAIDGPAPSVHAAAAARGFQSIQLAHAPGVSATRNAGAAATNAMSVLLTAADADTVAVFDADRLLDHRARRPIMQLVNGVVTELIWPATELRAGTDGGGNDLLLLVGDLGAGKTAFTQGFGAGLGVEDQVTSPTFSLVRQYEGRLDLNHLDVYRLEQVSEALDLGLSELLDEGAVTGIEWGDTILPALLSDYLVVRITCLFYTSYAADDLTRAVDVAWSLISLTHIVSMIYRL